MSPIGRGIRSATLAFILTCLLSASIVGTVTAVRRPSCSSSSCARLIQAAADEAVHYAVLAGVATIVVSCTILAGQRWPLWALRLLWGALIVGAGIAYVANRNGDFERLRDLLAPALPADSQIWLVDTTATLATTGLTLAAAFALLEVFTTSLQLIDRPLTHTRWDLVAAAVGVTVAVALTATLAAPALQKGDDSRNIDASTAAAEPVPALPSALGEQRFEIPFPLPDSSERTDAPRAAGSGFVALEGRPPRLTGYDADGRQRWHYSRTGPAQLEIRDFAVFDSGSVVIVDESNSSTVLFAALDAVTGSRLWTSDNPALTMVFDVPTGQTRSPFLVAREPDRWTAFDPRTGRTTWTIANPVRCPPGTTASPLTSLFPKLPFYIVDGATALRTINDCSTDGRIALRETAVDPATGHLLVERPVPGLDGIAPTGARRWFASAAGRDGYVATITWENRKPDLNLFVDAPTGRHDDLGDAASWGPSAADGSFLVRYSGTFRQYSGEGNFRCEFAASAATYVDVALLSDQIVELDTTDPRQTMIRLITRSDCREQATILAPVTAQKGDDLRFFVVPGVILLRHEESGGRGTLYGFASA